MVDPYRNKPKKRENKRRHDFFSVLEEEEEGVRIKKKIDSISEGPKRKRTRHPR